MHLHLLLPLLHNVLLALQRLVVSLVAVLPAFLDIKADFVLFDFLSQVHGGGHVLLVQGRHVSLDGVQFHSFGSAIQFHCSQCGGGEPGRVVTWLLRRTRRCLQKLRNLRVSLSCLRNGEVRHGGGGGHGRGGLGRGRVLVLELLGGSGSVRFPRRRVVVHPCLVLAQNKRDRTKKRRSHLFIQTGGSVGCLHVGVLEGTLGLGDGGDVQVVRVLQPLPGLLHFFYEL